MEAMELSVVINRPSEKIFAYLANLENDIKWRSEWVEAKNTSEGSLGLGATFPLVSELRGRRMRTIYETTEYELNRITSWKAVLGPLPLTFRRTFEHIEGGTRVTIKYEVKLRGYFKIIMSLLAGMVKQQHEGDLSKVKEWMDARAL